jgi:hypothetical protein
LNCVSLFFLLIPSLTIGQTYKEKKPGPATIGRESKSVVEEEMPEAQRRAFVISLVTSLADDARAYRDLALRPRVLARAADTLWPADTEMARALFWRAWEAAEKGDAEEVTLKANDNAPPMVVALRRISVRDLRSEVLNLAARRDRALAEEFLSKLTAATRKEADDSKNNSNTHNPSDGWSISEIESKRLQIARKLIDDGEIERALEFAAPALDYVSASSIGFLSALRQRSPERADQRFALLLARTEIDPSADANRVSGLSSYVFTPGLYVTFNSDGSARWTQPDEPAAPPNLSAVLRARFFQVAGSILLRPLPPVEQDFSSSGSTGKYMVVRRLLPFFDQYSPETASALHALLNDLAKSAGSGSANDNPFISQGLEPEESAGNTLEKMQDRLDHAKTSRQRDRIYADAAVALANQNDAHAQDLADKIDDPERRTQVRRYVDFQFVQVAIKRKEPSEVARLARAGQLTHTQRAWAYTQAAQLLMNSQRPRSLEWLQGAADEARRIDADDPDRARVLIGVATQLVAIDRVRAWETMGEAIKSANSADKFTGDNVQLDFSILPTRSGIKISSVAAKDFGLSGVIRLLTQEDLYRSLELARTFKNDAPRATATLAIARAVLEK